MRLWHIIFYIYSIDIHIAVFLLPFFIYIQRLVQTITEKQYTVVRFRCHCTFNLKGSFTMFAVFFVILIYLFNLYKLPFSLMNFKFIFCKSYLFFYFSCLLQ